MDRKAVLRALVESSVIGESEFVATVRSLPLPATRPADRMARWSAHGLSEDTGCPMLSRPPSNVST